MILLKHRTVNIENPTPVVTFDFETVGGWKDVDRFISIDGERTMWIGTKCGSCGFWFELISERDSIAVDYEDLNGQLSGDRPLNESAVVGFMSELLPTGHYACCHVEVKPVYVEPGGTKDYFVHEQLDAWDYKTEKHDPKIGYYRAGSTVLGVYAGEYRPFSDEVGQKEVLHDFLVPLYPQAKLNNARVSEYSRELPTGKRRWALALGMLDVKLSDDDVHDETGYMHTPEYPSHWCMAHYLVDGHHKVYAAAMSGIPVGLISFISLDQAWGPRVEELMDFYKKKRRKPPWKRRIESATKTAMFWKPNS